jgi:RNA polymerase sigma factor (sigma-70 family)
MEQESPDSLAGPDFEDVTSIKAILSPMPGAEEYEADCRALAAPDGVSDYLRLCYAAPRLSRQQEYHLFRQMRFLKFEAQRLEGDPSRAAEVEGLRKQAEAVRNKLVAANLRLIVPVAKRQLSWSRDPEALFSDGAFALVRAADKFDYTRGYRFSTYATQAITNAFASGRRPRPVLELSGHDLEHRLDGADDRGGILPIGGLGRPRTRHTLPDDDAEDRAGRRFHQLHQILTSLEPRTEKLMRMRYGLDGEGTTKSLDDVGTALGVSKQRVRQIEEHTIACLRRHAPRLALCC